MVYTNQYLMDLLGSKDLKDLVGKRPGELIQCIHAYETNGGCGTTESCRYCGAVNAIMQCLNTGQRAHGECRILAKADTGEEMAFDFYVTASPFRHNEKDFVILSFNDISHEKRRRVLEKLFFHDILNTAGGLRGFLEFLKEFPDDKKREELVNVAYNLSNQMIDEIVAQRELLSAENGELIPHFDVVSCKTLINQTIQQIEHHPIAFEKKILDR